MNDAPAFIVEGLNVRQVGARNAPSVFNAVFNFRNFWDGRANNIFSGLTPFGPSDPGRTRWCCATGNWRRRPSASTTPAWHPRQ